MLVWMGGERKDRMDIRPNKKGERWILHNGRQVTIMQKMGSPFWRVLTEKGTLLAVTDSDFVERLSPPYDRVDEHRRDGRKGGA